MCSLRSSSCVRSNNGSQVCPIPVGNSTCGEVNSLKIINDFNKLYEDRMDQVESAAGGDCLQEKIKLQQEWIKNLTQQNEMLIKAVQELEYEATERVHHLEEQLQKSAQCLCEVMKKYREHNFVADLLAQPLQKISKLEEDKINVLEFIRRIRETGDWNTDGLVFHDISEKDLVGISCTYPKLTRDDSLEGERTLNEKERTVQDLTQKLNYYNSFGDVQSMAREVQSRREELESLKQDMSDMRQALTEEVAVKHDEVIHLKKEVQIFEERCLQADKQTSFKEDIIRELRKEIKQLKQQVSHPEKRLNQYLPSPSHMLRQTFTSDINKQLPQSDIENPYIIVNHSSKKATGKNTVIYISKDGNVHKEVNYSEMATRKSLECTKDHTDLCNKCKNKLDRNKLFFPNCKSETDLANIKNMLKPIKQRSKLTNTTFNRCEAIVDQPIEVLNKY